MFLVLFTYLQALCADRKGVTAVEYGLIVAIMAAAIVTAFGYLSGALGPMLQGIAGKMVAP